MRTERIIIYSALFGAYDVSLIQKSQIENCDEYLKKFKFILFTNNKLLKSDIWDVVYVDKDPVENDNPRSSYYFKTLPHKVLPEYNFNNKMSVWLDSSIWKLDLKKLYELCQEVDNSDKSLYIEKHPTRHCVYQELEANCALNKDNKQDMIDHVNQYRKEGMPSNFGMVETGAQIRKHYDEKVIEFQELLWNEITTKTRRDQLSWNYCAWKLNFTNYHLFTFQLKCCILRFKDHPNKTNHKIKVLLAGPWLGTTNLEKQWSKYIRTHLESIPYDQVIVGCRPNQEHLYEDFADRFIISNPIGEIKDNLFNGKVPIFDIKTDGTKNIIQMNPKNSICNNFKLYDRSDSKIHILWATIRPEMFRTTYTEWLNNCDINNISLTVAVDTEEQKKEVESYLEKNDKVILVNNRKQGVTYPSYVLGTELIRSEVKDNDIVIFASDDFFPMKDWDKALLEEFSKHEGALLVNDKYGDPTKKRNIISIPIMTASTLRKLKGVIYHPDYIHCWSDNELHDNIVEMGLLKDIYSSNPDIYFEHRHFSNGGRQSDEIDRHHQMTNSEDMQRYMDRKKLTLQQKLEAKRVISFSLWGDGLKYTNGAIENVKLQQSYYPDWICRFYYDNTVPEEVISKLASMGSEMVYKERSVGCNGLAWRFEVAFDDTVDRFIIRDTDSRLNLKERHAVGEWMLSDKSFHIMRDHKNHGVPILGGMWGGIKGFIPNFKELYETWINKMPATNHQRDKYFNFDQIFLWQVIWPLVKNNNMAHDEMFKFTDEEKPYTFHLEDDLFIGQAFDENNKPIWDY